MKESHIDLFVNTCYSLAFKVMLASLLLISTRSKIVIYRLLTSTAEALLNCLGSLLSGEIDYPLYLFSVIYQTLNYKTFLALGAKLK